MCRASLLLLLLVALAARSQRLAVQAWNVQIYGGAKRAAPEFPAVVRLCRAAHLTFFQEIRDSSNASFLDLVAAMGQPFRAALSPRLGRSSSKEQYAYIYDSSRVSLVRAWVYEDARGVFERPPYLARVRFSGGSEATLIGLHAKPEDVEAELLELDAVYASVGGDAIILGDFNAGCSYLSARKESTIPLLTNEARYSVLINRSVDTTVSASECAYDRIVLAGSLRQHVLRVQVVDDFGALPAGVEPIDVSDHYPVVVELRLPVSLRLGLVAVVAGAILLLATSVLLAVFLLVRWRAAQAETDDKYTSLIE